MHPGTELDLIARCRSGDHSAWDALFDLHYTATSHFVFQLAPDFSTEDVEEICQEAFLAVIQNIHRFEGRSRFQTWVFRIAANKAMDWRERTRAAKRGSGIAPLSLQMEDPATGFVLDPISPSPGPAESLLLAERAQFLRACLDEVAPQCREVIELRYFGDLSYEEIGVALELNPKTVSSRLSKCLDRLQGIARRREEQEKNKPFPV